MKLLPESLQTRYLNGEGRQNMEDCLRVTFRWCAEWDIGKVVIFTATGDGPMHAVRYLLPEFPTLSLVAVTPPVGRVYRFDNQFVQAGIDRETKSLLAEFGIPVIAAQLPFKELYTGHARERASEWTRVAEALGVFGGGVPLCVQAIMMACDAGEVEEGERVAAMTADTSLVALASRTETFLSPFDGLLVEHMICRPSRYDISRREHRFLAKMWTDLPAPTEQLPLELPLPPQPPTLATPDDDDFEFED